MARVDRPWTVGDGLVTGPEREGVEALWRLTAMPRVEAT